MSPNAPPQDLFPTVNGVRLHVADWGGDGPPAVLLHATGFHARLWDPIARGLAPRFHVYALDARGHGDGDKPEGGYDWSVLVADVIGVMDALGLRGALGVGHSLGATTTAGVAAERPDLYDRVVLLDVILFPREFRNLPEEENPMAIAARKRREVWPSRDEM
ncbi:MAG: alpha/beta fold hydrolase, partial [Candidatus Binatia bacterium]